MTEYLELREKTDGTWEIYYPEEGFVPCPTPCNIKEHDKQHKCTRDRGWTKSSFGIRGISLPEPDKSYEAAMAYAEVMNKGMDREIKVINIKRGKNEGKDDTERG